LLAVSKQAAIDLTVVVEDEQEVRLVLDVIVTLPMDRLLSEQVSVSLAGGFETQAADA
jgi:hypothetical protein